MKIYVKILLLFALIANFGCKSNSKLELFKNEISVNGTIFFSSDSLLDPRHILVYKEYLIVCNFKSSPLIEIYNIQTKKAINKFLNIGNGPKEVLMVGNIQNIASNNELLVADLFQRKLFSYQLDKIVDTDKPNPNILYVREDKSPLMFDKLYKGNDIFIAESRDPRGRILLLGKDGVEKGYYLNYPSKEKTDKTLDDINNADLYVSTITISPSLDKVALATYSAGMIDVCETKGDRVEPLWNYVEFYPQGFMIVPVGDNSAVAQTKDSRSGFTSISSSDKYIYALFSGKLLEDPTYPYGEIVYVASWDGKQTYKIKLDKSINRLTVDAKDEYIYGITPEFDIVRFTIPKR